MFSFLSCIVCSDVLHKMLMFHKVAFCFLLCWLYHFSWLSCSEFYCYDFITNYCRVAHLAFRQPLHSPVMPSCKVFIKIDCFTIFLIGKPFYPAGFCVVLCFWTQILKHQSKKIFAIEKIVMSTVYFEIEIPDFHVIVMKLSVLSLDHKLTDRHD